MNLQVIAVIAQLCLTPNGGALHPAHTRQTTADCQISLTKCVLATKSRYIIGSANPEEAQSKALTDCIVDGRSK